MSTNAATQAPDERVTRLQRALGESYTIIEAIGGGGMGDVYLASHKTLTSSRWAIKVLADDLAKDPTLVERFMNEARIEASLQHPNIVKVVDVGQKENFHYLIMTYVEGEDLDKRLRRTRAMAVPEVVNIGLQVVGALECAHDNGIIHRDLKPSNIRMDRYGTAIVMDFGIARLRDASAQGKTVLGERLGTPLYMSPEQAQGRTVDARSDLYSLGVILYEMLAGSNPFDADNPYAICLNHLQVEPPWLTDLGTGIPEELAEIVDRLLAKDPDERYQKVTEVREALAALNVTADVRTPRPATQAVVPEHLRNLGPLDAVLNRIPDLDPGPLSTEVRRIFDMCDGTRNIRTILNSAGVGEEEAAAAITSLSNSGVVYSEIPLTSDDTVDPPTIPTPAPKTQPPTRRRVDLATRRQNKTAPPTKPVEPLQAAPQPVRSRKLWAVVAAVVIIVGALAAYLSMRGSALAPTIQVDASPFARVTIKTASGQVLREDDTPFAVALQPGTYTFDFASGEQTRTETRTIDSKSSGPVRVDFWTPDKIKTLLEGYR